MRGLLKLEAKLKFTAVLAASAVALCLAAPAYATTGYQRHIHENGDHHARLVAGASSNTQRTSAHHNGPVRGDSPPIVRPGQICAFGIFCLPNIFDLPAAEAAPPPVSPKAKIAHPIDRSRFAQEIVDHPELIQKMAWMVNGEVGRHAPTPVRIVQLETAFNRAQARGETLAHVLLSVKESPEGYYAVDTYSAEAKPTPEEVEEFKDTVLHAVLAGSNLSDIGYGPMTGNASSNLARHQFQHGTPGYHLAAGDSYFREGPFTNPFPLLSGLFGGNS